MVLPGFRQFRLPAKLFTFTALGLAALAGIGWDDLLAGRAGRIVALFTSFLVLSLAVLAGVWIARPAILTVFRAAAIASNFGPFDADGGFRALVRSLAQASIVLGLGRVVVCQGPNTSPVGWLVRLAAGNGRPGGGQCPMRLDRPANRVGLKTGSPADHRG